MANEVILSLQGVDSGYGDIEVLHDISFEVTRGDIVSVLGANGAGKSTLMKTIFGILTPTNGEIGYKGQRINGKPSVQLLNMGISFLPEGRSNFPAMTVEENLEMGGYTLQDQNELRNRIKMLFERFPILFEKRNVEAGNLSGGQQQILEIAMALMLKPEIILIDEPTLGLAPILVTEVFQIIQEIQKTGTTVILVEQNAKRALEISDYAIVLELGKIRIQGKASELAQESALIAAYLGER
ncbi:MAG TPA: ABC transporter ATP-binding protein [Bellilinea sp.]|nr:ABC transporter ATP-binding protein [Bellilinea sp.]